MKKIVIPKEKTKAAKEFFNLLSERKKVFEEKLKNRMEKINNEKAA